MGLLTSVVFVPHDLPYDRLCNSLHIRQGTLDTSSLLPCTHFMVRWIRLLYFLAHASCYVGNVFSTSLHIRQGTLDTSSLLPCRAFSMSLLTAPKASLQKWYGVPNEEAQRCLPTLGQ